MACKWDQEVPLARAKFETQRANNALRDYITMGPGRSLSKLLRKYTGRTPEEALPPTRWLRTLKGWSSRYAWQARLARWEELERKRDEAMWEERRREEREAEWDNAESLRAEATKMEQFPLAKVEKRETVEETYPDGRAKVIQSITIVQPAKWGRRDIARHREVAAKLARLAADMETEKKQVDITSKGEQVGRTELSDAELAAEIAELAARIAEIEGADEGEAPEATDPGGAHEP